ncbi:glycosyltransferase family 59 protein [Bipolaris zeicola 26-R-13]|uniref:Dol-P-Glc:Glc(2)Man(9)GlcNAc(2)-PP-Dol alpha-1,2-glucosyltransferase n=1 Tax=Cochliobolus carbonum (strain 26-R-13) TaxID=930089 RepID=W6Y2M1_COCC2|nr:glycosyltransferase family 59 protein [Bipolaris zeicola 26-R-13]EUC32163.1 glycosyltransferase family 59 protein [Bipolaris zeicola 26-R-13]
MASLLEVWSLPGALIFIVCLTVNWTEYVSSRVPKPYLDEFFHVPQAQKYCEGDYSWDPKITTPPGLYLVSKLFNPLLGCETRFLRMQNTVALCAILPMSYLILRILRACNNPSKPSTKDSTLFTDVHSAVNIALFPPLFFFSGLYYTDVMSTLVVLFAYTTHLASPPSSLSPLLAVSVLLSGILALFFRQTNIFWVAVFPAGLAVVNALKADGPSTASKSKDVTEILRDSWATGRIIDPPVQDANVQDVIIFVASVVVAALSKPLLVIKIAMPYAIILALFAGFVVWNGSVVLGDKSAHTATINMPQMLYIWPYFAFFSIPLLVGPFLRLVVPVLPKQIQTTCDKAMNTSTYRLPSLLASSMFVTWALLAVHFNTIIHPYTLADNRHYVFYVFKILRLYPALRYIAVPVYFICAWSIINALATPRRATHSGSESMLKDKGKAGSPPISADNQSCPVSFVVIWLAATTLSVVTAPLVEPRYFIIPWVIWRLHVARHTTPNTEASPSSSTWKSIVDVRMVLETIWLLAINLAVSYVFLNWTFTWPNEPGNLQRFIW